MKGIKYYSDELIVESLKKMVENRYTFLKAQEELGIPKSTLNWWYLHKLPFIDIDLYCKLFNVVFHHKHFKNRSRISK